MTMKVLGQTILDLKQQLFLCILVQIAHLAIDECYSTPGAESNEEKSKLTSLNTSTDKQSTQELKVINQGFEEQTMTAEDLFYPIYWWCRVSETNHHVCMSMRD